MEESRSANAVPQRRKFILDLAKISGITLLLNIPFLGRASNILTLEEEVTAGEIIDLFISKVGAGAFPKTVDTLKSGSRGMKVTGIVTTMFATIDVIRKAIALNANFIIAHEPTFYNHLDETAWLANDDVYQFKAELLKKHMITVWRNHDYIHTLKPDGVGAGLLKQLNWASYFDQKTGTLNIPAIPLSGLIEFLKTKLNISKVRYIGDLKQDCKKVLFLPGAAGGTTQISMLSKLKPDVLICGEIQEWETAEYIRDARAKGDQVSLVVLGHVASEEAGSEFMAGWLRTNFPDLKTTHVPSTNSLSFY
ncbi:MAG: Nif3-like dinuclear metal center hexameric protein [Pedobacter sp.]|uniref:Nif3-like dinuclear metal center hexameric protein n=1 Tax=Pedobacter sp. TaxID=1411316 RepID=UPI00339210DE